MCPYLGSGTVLSTALPGLGWLWSWVGFQVGVGRGPAPTGLWDRRLERLCAVPSGGLSLRHCRQLSEVRVLAPCWGNAAWSAVPDCIVATGEQETDAIQIINFYVKLLVSSGSMG